MTVKQQLELAALILRMLAQLREHDSESDHMTPPELYLEAYAALKPLITGDE